MPRLEDCYAPELLPRGGYPVGYMGVIVKEQQLRIAAALAAVLHAGAMPRRLGQDASRPELAADKQIARRVGHVLTVALRSAWGGSQRQVAAADQALAARTGAQLTWATWVPEHAEGVAWQMKVVATYAVTVGERRWGNRHLNALINEHDGVLRALRVGG